MVYHQSPVELMEEEGERTAKDVAGDTAVAGAFKIARAVCNENEDATGCTIYRYTLSGLPASAEGGWHVHTGTSCSDAAADVARRGDERAPVALEVRHALDRQRGAPARERGQRGPRRRGRLARRRVRGPGPLALPGGVGAF